MKKELTLKQQIENKVGTRFSDIAGREKFNTELSFCLQHIDRNPQLKKATVQSNIQAVLNIALTGLTLNPVLKYAYLVPRSRNLNGQWVIETHLEPSYMGLCKLLTDTGSVKRIYSHPVYKGDNFRVTLGVEMSIEHEPKFETRDLEKVYAVAVLNDGSHMVEVMTLDQINDIKERSESFKAFKSGKVKSCVWVSDEVEMSRKTVIRRLFKYLPKTDQWERVAQAIELDNADYKATDGQIQFIESLLMNANIDHDENASIYRELNTMNSERAEELINYLQENQLDPISSGNNYNQTDIKEKLKNEIN